MKILIIGAHPDDETFGMGGTISRHIADGDEVYCLACTDGVTARHEGDSAKTYIARQQAQFRRAMSIYGVKEYKHWNLKDQQLDITPLLFLVKEIEAVITDVRPDRIYTHSAADVGQDHRRVNEAVMVAARPVPGSSVKSVVCFPSPSSTWWGDGDFRPNYFVDISGPPLRTKLAVIIGAYPHESPHSPHPRSGEMVELHGKMVASLLGYAGHAEEFEIVRWLA